MPRVLLLSLFASLLCTGQTRAQDLSAMLVPKEVVILRSTKEYSVALQTARQAAQRLRLPLDLEGYHPHPGEGLTLSKAACADSGFDYPAYIPRGYGLVADSAFISIEYSNGYSEFAKGYYLVVAAVGRPGSQAVRQASSSSKHWYTDAYTKRTEVYIGCMH